MRSTDHIRRWYNIKPPTRSLASIVQRTVIPSPNGRVASIDAS
jgi:hypothetical protein